MSGNEIASSAAAAAAVMMSASLTGGGTNNNNNQRSANANNNKTMTTTTNKTMSNNMNNSGQAGSNSISLNINLSAGNVIIKPLSKLKVQDMKWSERVSQPLRRSPRFSVDSRLQFVQATSTTTSPSSPTNNASTLTVRPTTTTTTTTSTCSSLIKLKRASPNKCKLSLQTISAKLQNQLQSQSQQQSQSSSKHLPTSMTPSSSSSSSSSSTSTSNVVCPTNSTSVAVTVTTTNTTNATAGNNNEIHTSSMKNMNNITLLASATNTLKVAPLISNGLTTTTNTSTSLGVGVSSTATAIRALNASGQTTPVRLVMPPGLMTPTVFKQLDPSNAASATGGARTAQITAIPGAGQARALGQPNLTVARPLTQTTYLPRAGVTTTQMAAMGQRLLTPLRATPTSSTGGGMSMSGGFVRAPSSVQRHTASPSSALTPPSNTTWMNTSGGQVQLIRALPQQTRQRIISTSGLTTVTTAQNNVSSAASVLTSQATQSAYVTNLASVLPPRPHTLVYSNTKTNTSGGSVVPVPGLTPTSAGLSQTAAQQHNSFNLNATTGARIAVATSGGAAGSSAGGAGTTRQLRPIPLGKSFATTKLNPGSISLRNTNMPHLAPTLSNVSMACHMSRNSISTAVANTANLNPSNLSTTRIIQLQQQQQTGGPTGRLTGNVMLQPIIVNSQGKIAGFRPPVTMGGKVQPSLTITHVAGGKLSSGTATSGTATNSTSHVQSSNTTSTSAAHLFGSTGSFVPVALAARSASMAIAGSGSIYAGNLTPISLNKAFMANNNLPANAAEHHGLTAAERSSGIFLQNASLNFSSMAHRSAPITVVSAPNSSITNSSTATTNSTTTTAATATNLSTTDGIPAKINNKLLQTTCGTLATTTTTITTTTSTTVATSHMPTTTTATSSNAAQTPLNYHTSNVIVSSNASAANVSTSSSNSGIFITANNSNNSNNNSNSSNTIYYESMPQAAASGVLSINPSNSAAQQQKHSTFTVVSSSNTAVNNMSSLRTLTQLHLPTVSGTATLPVRLATTVAATHLQQQQQHGSSSSSGTLTNTTPSAGVSTANSLASNSAIATVLQVQQPALHSIIPMRKMNNVSNANMTTNPAAVVSNFLRKRDIEGNTVRAAKNLAPTLIAMSSNSNKNSSASSSLDSSNLLSNNDSPSHSICDLSSHVGDHGGHPSSANVNALTIDVGKSERDQCESPLSTDGSTTVSVNSSPNVDQMENSVIYNRHNEFYDYNRNGSQINDNNSNQHSLVHQVHNQHAARLNGPKNDYISRKKLRRSDSATALYGSGSINHSLTSNDSLISAGNGHTYSTSSTSSNSNASIYNGGGSDGESVQNGCIYNKENKEPVDYVFVRPRPVSIMGSYRPAYKLPHNHFVKPAEVKPREERRPTIHEIASDPNINKTVSGWKVYQVSAQLDDLCEAEFSSYNRMNELLNDLENAEEEDESEDWERMRDLLKGTMQRTQIVYEGVQEARSNMMRIVEHKPQVSAILQKYATKRNFKKRDKM